MTKITFSMLVLAGAAIVYSSIGMAQEAKAKVAGTACLTETASVSVSFNSVETDVTAVSNKFTSKIQEIEQTAKESGAEKTQLQSSNYSISPQNYNSGNNQYNFTGNMNFNITPANKGVSI